MTDSSDDVKGTGAPNPRFRCILIPSEICARKDLNCGDKIIFGCIFTLSRASKRKCFAHNRTFAKMCGVTEHTVQRIIRKLEKRGLVLRIMDDQHHRSEIRVLWRQRTTVPGSYQDYLASDHWQETRARALDRAMWRCQVCNTPRSQSILDVHHRTYERLGAELPEDLAVLCRECHSLFHEKRSLAK